MKYLAAFLFFLGGIAPVFAQNDTQRKIDSLEQVIATTKEDTTKARSLCWLCWYLHVVGKMDSALEKGKTGLKLAREADDKISEETCLTNIGTLHAIQGDYIQALEFYKKSIKIKEESGDISGQIGPLNNIGNIYLMQGSYARALDYFQKSLKMSEEVGARGSEAASLNNIGNIYELRGNYAHALDYYQKSLSIKVEIGQRKGEGGSLVNIANIYDNQGDNIRALNYYQKSVSIFEEIGEKKFKSNALFNIGNIYEKQGKSRLALDYFQNSLKIQKEIGDRNGEAATLANIGVLKVNTEQAPEGRSLATRALDIAKEIGALNRMQEAAFSLSKADSALGNWKSAYEHYKLFKQYSDSLKNDEQSKEIGRLEAKYEFDQEIAERERKEAEAAERREMIMWVAIGVFSALLIVAGLLVWGFQTKKKANKQLSAQNEEIRTQSEEISQQRDELQALYDQLAVQKAEVEQARDEIAGQHEKLEKAHEEITDSIDYASRIQRALLPAEPALQKSAEACVYYKPRDVVSGDFYWMNQLDDDTALYSAADCTGHGVPGAFMSVLGATTLDTIVREYGETRPDKMLKLLDQNIRQSLKQDETEDGSLDGMDLALIKLDKKNRKLYFSSAGRPLFLQRNGEMLEYKGAKFPAGGAQHGDKEFPLIEIDLEPGDRIFMCSDGVTDQFGGPRKRKFSPKRLKETLLAHQDEALPAQFAAFSQTFDEWQQNAKQLDDQLLMALEV